MISCNECGAQCKNFVSLAQHVTKVHKVDTESYFLKHIGSKGSCSNCNKPTSFINIRSGYRLSCGNSCAAVIKRKLLKEDQQKFKSFSDKVSNNMKTIWKTEDRTEIIKKASNTNKQRNQKLSPEERRVKFNGNPKGHAKSWIDWWNSASEEQKHNARIKTFEKSKITIANKSNIATDDMNYQDTLWYFANKDRLMSLFS